MIFQGNFIDGKLQNPLRNEWFDIINPSNETVLSRSAKSGKEDVDAAVQAAKAAQEQWGTTSGSQRAAFLRKIADAVEANADALSIKEASNSGKPLKEAAWDVSDVSVAFRSWRYAHPQPFICSLLRTCLTWPIDSLPPTPPLRAGSMRTWRRSSTRGKANPSMSA
jgi:hypothetical protein